MQHPSLYSPPMLEDAKRMLADFLAGMTPLEMRRAIGKRMDSGNRTWKITGTPESQGEYAHPVQWQMTARTVVASGPEHYIEHVKRWAQSIYDDLRVSGNLTP